MRNSVIIWPLRLYFLNVLEAVYAVLLVFFLHRRPLHQELSMHDTQSFENASITDELFKAITNGSADLSAFQTSSNDRLNIFDYGQKIGLGHMNALSTALERDFVPVSENARQDPTLIAVEDDVVGCCACSACTALMDSSGYMTTEGPDNGEVPMPNLDPFSTQMGTGNGAAAVALSGDVLIDGLLIMGQWTDTTINYSFPRTAEAYNYVSGAQDFLAFDANYQAAGHFALSATQGNAASAGFSFEGFTAVNVDFLGNTDEGSAHIRMHVRDGVAGGAARDFPISIATDSTDDDGDLWVGNNSSWSTSGLSIQAGLADWHTVLHETGHALGLKHGHVGFSGNAENTRLPAEFNGFEYSVMTYNTYIGSNEVSRLGDRWGAVEDFDWPQSFMMLDIAALQYMYGADFTTNAGDTTYSWNPGSGDTVVNGQVAIDAAGDTIFATIWDGGGFDTYDLSAFTTNLRIDLRPGENNVFAQDQLSDLGFGNLAEGNIYNALLFEGNTASLIESAIGGSGNDDILGNAGDNLFYGGRGNDIMNGGGGDYNQVNYDGALSEYRFTQNTNGSVTVVHPQWGTDTLTDIDGVWFQGEGSWYSLADAVALTGGDTGGGSGGGNPGGTVFNGTAAQDNWLATNADETFNGGNGIEYDQVDYRGSLSDYTFTRNADGTTTVEGFGSTDTLSRIEGIWFQGEGAWYSIENAVAVTGGNTGGNTVFNGTNGQDFWVATNTDETFNGGAGPEYDQVDYGGALSDYTFTRNADGSVTVEGSGFTDTLRDIDGIWFQGEGTWYSVADAVALTGDNGGNAGGNVFIGTAAQDVWLATNADETFNGGNGIEYDQVDYAGTAADYTFSQNADGSFTVTGLGSTDTLINIEGIWFQGSAEWAAIDTLI